MCPSATLSIRSSSSPLLFALFHGSLSSQASAPILVTYPYLLLPLSGLPGTSRSQSICLFQLALRTSTWRPLPFALIWTLNNGFHVQFLSRGSSSHFYPPPLIRRTLVSESRAIRVRYAVDSQLSVVFISRVCQPAITIYYILDYVPQVYHAGAMFTCFKPSKISALAKEMRVSIISETAVSEVTKSRKWVRLAP
jgi:hypothetical protein